MVCTTRYGELTILGPPVIWTPTYQSPSPQPVPIPTALSGFLAETSRLLIFMEIIAASFGNQRKCRINMRRRSGLLLNVNIRRILAYKV
jgi:hypothetical protein